MPKTTLWKLQPHTRAKHRLLEEYLKVWFPVMGRWKSRVLFLDGFAGPGRYEGGEPGSPIIAINTLVNHTAFARLGHCEFLFLFSESDPDRFASLETELAALKSNLGGSWPGKIRVQTWPAEFRDGAGAIVQTMQVQRKQLAPTFAFVDPFGFKGVPMRLIAELLAYPQCEVLFNFMIESVNRWATSGVVDAHLDEMFGCSDYASAPASGPARQDFLHELYRRQLLAVGNFKFVRSFEMINGRSRTGNDLFFGTQSEKGIEAMKTAMWKVDPEEGSRFDATDDPSVMSLFGNEPRFDLLRDQIVRRFAGQRVPISEVERFVLLDTDFLPASHLKTKVLVPMETSGQIATVDNRIRVRSFPAGCQIRFAS